MIRVDVHVRWIVSYRCLKITLHAVSIDFFNRWFIGNHPIDYWRVYRWIVSVSFPWIIDYFCRTILVKVDMAFPLVMHRDCLVGCHLFTILVYVMDGFSDVFIQVVYIHASWIIWTIRICWIYRSIWRNWMVWIDIHVRWIVSYCFFKIVSLTITINFRNRWFIGEHIVNYWRIYRWVIFISYPWII
ncbi:hypothetical protein IV82_GL001822 [Pediococcus acidilactici]|nr:hypothetical protein IV82_GL001822 [Pediococcus acidilactici]